MKGTVPSVYTGTRTDNLNLMQIWKERTRSVGNDTHIGALTGTLLWLRVQMQTMAWQTAPQSLLMHVPCQVPPPPPLLPRPRADGCQYRHSRGLKPDVQITSRSLERCGVIADVTTGKNVSRMGNIARLMKQLVNTLFAGRASSPALPSVASQPYFAAVPNGSAAAAKVGPTDRPHRSQ